MLSCQSTISQRVFERMKEEEGPRFEKEKEKKRTREVGSPTGFRCRTKTVDCGFNWNP